MVRCAETHVDEMFKIEKKTDRCSSWRIVFGKDDSVCVITLWEAPLLKLFTVVTASSGTDRALIWRVLAPRVLVHNEGAAD